MPVPIIFLDWTLKLFYFDNNIVKPNQTSQSDKLPSNIIKLMTFNDVDTRIY